MRSVNWKRGRSGFLSITQRETASASVAVGMWATRKRCPSCSQPRRRRLPLAKPPLAFGRPAPGADAARCTTRFENAHGNGSKELLYRWHPWCDRRVWVREAMEKPGGLFFRCALSNSAADHELEVPAWMFDRAACAERAMLSDAPFARMAALCRPWRTS